MAKEIKSNYNVIGVMAGSSMDGLDIAEVVFSQGDDVWTFEVGRHETVRYDEKITLDLKNALDVDINSQKVVDAEFGAWIGEQLNRFGSEVCDLIAVHGHTLTHKPADGISWQLGRGDGIAEVVNSPVITDFRTLDVTLGGQGAPLVPLGDFELFRESDACLNLGGIANVSIRDKKVAWDICPCNQILNRFSEELGHAFDEGGKLARRGNRNHDWIKEIATISYFNEDPPKSLPNSFINEAILDKIDPKDGLRSYTEFMADQVVCELEKWLPSGAKILVTGGGALNDFLVELLNTNKCGLSFVLPDHKIVEFKEAIIFGFLGLLKWRNEINVLASVTGASRDSSSGIIHYPK